MNAALCPKCHYPLDELDLQERRVAYCLRCDLAVIPSTTSEPRVTPSEIPRCSADRREAEEVLL